LTTVTAFSVTLIVELGRVTWFGATCQEPLKCIINPLRVPLAFTTPSPTAHSSLADTAATAFRATRTVGTVASVHAVPSQCSAIAVTPGDLPTAQASVADSATTPRSPPRPVPPGFGPVGTGTSRHAVPSQCSAQGTFGSWFTATAAAPTAHTSLVAVPLTALSRSLRNCGLGARTWVHAVPFQCSVSPPCSSSLAVSPNTPTAQASVAVRGHTP
jgi:hypothetical protein